MRCWSSSWRRCSPSWGRLHWLIFIHLLLYFIVCRPAPSRRLRPPGRRRGRTRGARRSVQHREPTVPPDRSRGATGLAGPREPGGHDRDRSRERGRSRVIPLTAAAAGMALVPSGTVPPRRPEPVAAGSAAPIRRGDPAPAPARRSRAEGPGAGRWCRPQKDLGMLFVVGWCLVLLRLPCVHSALKKGDAEKRLDTGAPARRPAYADRMKCSWSTGLPSVKIGLPHKERR